MLDDLWFRLRAMFRRGRVERELDEELRFHLEQAVAAYEREGCSPDEARQRARLQFGGLEQIREDCRDARGLNLVDSAARDLRYAVRGLLRSPGFASVAVLSLAIGIGANAAIFAVVDAFLFRPAPVKDVDALVALADRSDKYAGYPISYPNFLDWKVRNHAFDETAAYWNGNRVLGDDEGAERIRELDVSEGFLRVVGVVPVVGRGFLPEDHGAGAGAVALVSYELWQRRLGGDRGAIGKTITLDSRPFTVIGVPPAGFNIGGRARRRCRRLPRRRDEPSMGSSRTAHCKTPVRPPTRSDAGPCVGAAAHFQGTPGQVAPALSHPGGGLGRPQDGSGTGSVCPSTLVPLL
ncbi:MAG: ABC transporter permease [Acidobacteria bacterium]|nr:ABC transporter permease [Acidobacteriota bacterium]